jgi:hypothetical protein
MVIELSLGAQTHEDPVRDPMNQTSTFGPRGLQVALLAALLGIGSTACFVEFDLDAEGPFACTSNKDCASGKICVKEEGKSRGSCLEREDEVEPTCIDGDEDGFGDGDTCAGPDCDDNDPNVYPGAPELCDGKDNDCDCAEVETCTVDLVDEETPCTSNQDCILSPVAPGPGMVPDSTVNNLGLGCVIPEGETEGTCKFRCPLDTIGVCAGAKTSCQTADNGDGTFTATLPVCATSGAYGPDFHQVAEADEPCDGMDNNCNGRVDDSDNCVACEPATPKVCSNNFGICTQGIRECSAEGVPGDCVDSVTGDPVPVPSDEVCNGLDDDCDGRVDNSATGALPGSICPDGCPWGMVLIADGAAGFCIDRWEASRADATDTNAGTDNSFATSRAGVLPWTGINASEARNACRGGNLVENPRKELCSPGQIQTACQAGASQVYPYGDTYDGATCNGVDNGSGAVLATGSMPACVTPEIGGRPGVFDLSGNVEEFVLINSDPRLYGGSIQDDSADMTCTSDRNGQGAVGPNIGFRCCIAPQH